MKIKNRFRLFFPLVFVSLILVGPLPAGAFPTVDSVRCVITNELRDGSASTGALEDTMCLLRVGFSDLYNLANDARNVGSEENFGCLVEKGEVDCNFEESELQALNAAIQEADVNPRFLGTRFTDRGPMAQRFGCLGVTRGSRRTTSPFVIPSPRVNTGNEIGTKCLDNENCSLTVTYLNSCVSLPESEEDPNALPQCRAAYQSCVAENLLLQIQLGACRNSISVSIPLANFPEGLDECNGLLGSCRLSNFQLASALFECRS